MRDNIIIITIIIVIITIIIINNTNSVALNGANQNLKPFVVEEQEYFVFLFLRSRACLRFSFTSLLLVC